MMNYIKYINILNDDNASRNPVKGYEVNGDQNHQVVVTV